MIIAPYKTDRYYDEILSYVLKSIMNNLKENEDDFLMLCCGSTGSGKSMLMLEVMEEFLKENANVDLVGLDRGEFANALQKSKDMQLPRFCANDEANISKRDHSSQYNKDLLDLYFSIRGLQIFHWWNNPSLNIIDKPFIEERIKGFIFITSKEKKRPRIYYYFRKTDLLKIWEKYESLNFRTLKKAAKQYAYYRGWFKKYDGALLAAYKEKKDKRMNFKVDDFKNKWGDKNTITRRELAQNLGVTKKTILDYARKFIQEGKIDSKEIIIHGNAINYPKKYIPLFEEELIKSANK